MKCVCCLTFIGFEPQLWSKFNLVRVNFGRPESRVL